MFMHTLKNVIEAKIEAKTMDFKTYMKLLSREMQTSQPNEGYPLCFLTRDFGKYISDKVKEDKNITFTDLNTVQDAIQRQSIAFQEANDTYRAVVGKAIKKIVTTK